MTLLAEYIIALTNLYGIIDKNKIIEIYNSQNKDPIVIVDVEAYLKNPPEELVENFVEIYRDCFVNESIIEFDEFDIMLAKKADKPYYIPDKEELLKYTDEWYFEKTKQYWALYEYIKKNIYDGDDNKTQTLIEDIWSDCNCEYDIKMVMNEFNRVKINNDGIEQVNQVTHLVTEFSNNIRIWENNGYTPNETFENTGNHI